MCSGENFKSWVEILPRFVKKKNKPNKFAICVRIKATTGFDLTILFHGIDANDIVRFFPLLPVKPTM